jgi:hypothetical protein
MNMTLLDELRVTLSGEQRSGRATRVCSAARSRAFGVLVAHQPYPAGSPVDSGLVDSDASAEARGRYDIGAPDRSSGSYTAEQLIRAKPLDASNSLKLGPSSEAVE